MNIWKSNDEWTFKPFEGSLFHIENISKSEVLGIASNEVVMETLAQNNQNQMWEISNKGLSNHENYFILKNFASQKVLTAVSTTTLETKGTYHSN